MSVGLWAKLKELVMTYPSGSTIRPVVGPTPLRMPGPVGGPAFFPPPSGMTSAPPAVSILTTAGATLAEAVFIAFSVASFTSWARAAGAVKKAAATATQKQLRRTGVIGV